MGPGHEVIRRSNRVDPGPTAAPGLSLHEKIYVCRASSPRGR